MKFKRKCRTCGAEFAVECDRACNAARRLYCDDCRLKNKRLSAEEYRRRNHIKPRKEIVLIPEKAELPVDSDTRVRETYNDGRLVERIHHRGGGFYATYKH